MTCRHVLGLVDAGPFAGYSDKDLEAARRHARDCATCGRALAATETWTTDLTTMPQPAPTRDLSGAVLARIARIEQLRTTSAAVAAGDIGSVDRAPRWSPWAAAFGAAAAIFVFSPSTGGAITDVVSLRNGSLTAGLVGLPTTSTDALVLAAGVVLYLVGFFAPPRRSRP